MQTKHLAIGIGLVVTFATAIVIAAIIISHWNKPSVVIVPADSPFLKQGSKGPPIITQAEYDQIEVGMTHEQVVKIIGDPGEHIMRGWYDDGRRMFTWVNERFVSSAQIIFSKDDTVLEKFAENLK